MSYKTIAVWLDAQCSAPVDAALALAAIFDSHVTALNHVDLLQVPSHVRVHLGEQFDRPWRARAEAAAAAAATAFEAAAQRAGRASVELRPLDGDLAQALDLSARYADLVVMGQFNPESGENAHHGDFPDRVILTCGRPVLLMPYVFSDAGSLEGFHGHVLIAWSATRESTRAVIDALPLLQRAREVTVITLNAPPVPDRHGALPGAGIAQYLARHGVNVSVRNEETTGIDAGAMLLSRAADLSADLLVMGAYGHSRLRELVLGGVTRTVLREMTLPVLLSH